MSCPHATTTTIAWMYGEGPESHDLHVAECDDCAAVLDEHVDVLSAVGDDLPALRQHGAVDQEFTRPSPVRWVASAALLTAAAAVALFAVWPTQQVTPAPAASPVPLAELASAPLPEALFEDDLDRRIDDLDADLDYLSLNLGTL